MMWNWQQPNWPNFTYDRAAMMQKERQFLLAIGTASALYKNVTKDDQERFLVEILSLEGLESSKIEGELLERESLQSSIRRHFGLQDGVKPSSDKEAGMAELLAEVYKSYNSPLTHEMLGNWHAMLFKQGAQIHDTGCYRTHQEPMQIVSRRYDSTKVFFEAPPSDRVPDEMTRFINWFNGSRQSEPILGRAALAHVYFESIHPFEDGNGRIGRVLVEKVLSQGVEQPILIAVSKCVEKRKKDYYNELGRCNCSFEIDHWVNFFADVILEAQDYSMQLLQFLIKKSRLFAELKDKLNPRQEKALLRVFAEGPSGFVGGLSADNYMTITKASRATTTRDLADLVEKGALVKTGELRHTRYWLK